VRRRLSTRWMTTKISSRTPITIFVHQELSVPSNVMMVWIRPSTSTPSTEPRTNPVPPVSSVPAAAKPRLELPAELPCLRFDGRARFGTEGAWDPSAGPDVNVHLVRTLRYVFDNGAFPP
jgi:hypothetical protein